MRRVKRYIALPPEERQLFREALRGLLAVDLGLRTAGYARVSRRLEVAAFAAAPPAPPAAGDDAATAATVEAAVWAVAAAARLLPYTVKCMTRSLVLRRLLAARGIAAELVIGVRTGEDGFTAHAWVERGGRPVGEREDVRERYAALSAAAR